MPEGLRSKYHKMCGTWTCNLSCVGMREGAMGLLVLFVAHIPVLG